MRENIREVNTMNHLSKQNKIEDKLRVSEEKYRNLITKMMNAFALHEMVYNEEGEAVDYKFLELNPAWENIVGIKSEDVIGKTILQVFPDAKDIWIEQYNRVVQTGVVEEFEQFSAIAQKYFYCYVYRPEKGQFAVIFNDTTKSRLDTEELEKSQSIAKIGSWSFDIKSSTFRISDNAFRMLGLDNKVALTYETFMALVHTEDRNPLEKVWKNTLNGADYNAKYRIIVDNKILWIEEKAKIEFDENGKPLKILATAQDITNEKR